MKWRILPLLALAFSISAFAASPINDAQITKVILTIDKGESDLGKLAKATSKNSAVLGFADHMITDHMKSEQKVTNLAKKLSWTPLDSEKSKTMKADGDKTKTDLMSLKDPKAFDVAYMDAMVADHHKVLKGMDEVLIPSAKNEELKAILKSKRDTVAMHLKHAEEVQGKL